MRVIKSEFTHNKKLSSKA